MRNVGQIFFFIAVVVAFKDTVYILYYEIHLKYCQDMAPYISINRQFYTSAMENNFGENTRVACLSRSIGIGMKNSFHLNIGTTLSKG
jgi:hypothetical protein